VEYLTLAERLYGESEEEDQAMLRTAVSRAYYAAFLTWRERIGHEDPGYSPHLRAC